MGKPTFTAVEHIQNFFCDLFRIESDRIWNTYVPMSRDEAKKILAQDLPRGVKIDISINRNGRGNVHMAGKGIYEERPFDLGKKVVNTGYMELSKQDKGIGRNIMRNEIEFFSACGANKYKIYAALEAGGYAWARFGFLPEYPGDIKDTVTSRFNRLKPIMRKKELDVLQHIIDFDTPKDIWDLADLPIDLAPRLRKIFKDAAKGEKDAKILRKKLLKIPYVTKSLFNKKALNEPQNLGRVLLARSEWDGYLDFTDNEQMARVEKYVGGWKKINPATALAAPG